MPRVLIVLIANIVVLGSCGASLYWVAPAILRLCGISEYASGFAAFELILICIGSVLFGAVAGLFLFPLALRPFLSGVAYWDWIRREPGWKIPVLDRLLDQWATVLFGGEASNKRLERTREG